MGICVWRNACVVVDRCVEEWGCVCVGLQRHV